ncbi:tudor domain-containing protein 15 isoform X2 [Sphaerodactylus townsendi]|uniref:tudor domain-containing protein 15 isoform X2 n=1 Tax=Sphaerodactylus townsendi TaxID=933632 RepID=UPI002025BE3F|nr:tudor domain-containing protein 15 isoform X2 [Sphaerodactylus townsendi]
MSPAMPSRLFKQKCGMDLPTKFIDIDLKITNIYCHLKDVLVKFEGSCNADCEFDYHILQNEIQQVSKVKDCIGIGELCLVEDPNCGEWYRGRVIQKKNHIYEVFLIDSGGKIAVQDICIASAIDELFQLPPKMVCGIFANMLPVEEKWSPKALNYFSSLVDLQIKGHVQAIIPYHTYLLDVPKVTSDVIELKLGKLVDGDSFRLIVELLADLSEEPIYKQMPDLIQKKYKRPDSAFYNGRIQPDFQPVLGRLQPLLSVGGVELAKISVAISPSKFYCQPLLRLPELDELTNSMSSYYETVNKENIPSCDSLGVLCAAKRRDGHWYRGVIQELLSDYSVKIWFVDIGNCEAVPSTCVLKLQSKFISVPTFSFPCALSCLSDQNESVRNSQLKEFTEVLLRQSMVYLHIDLFDADEHLYYVTLHKHESTRHGEYVQQGNDVVPKCCPSCKTEITYEDMKISDASPFFAKPAQKNVLQSGNCSNVKDCPISSVLAIPDRTTEMKVDAVCVAFVEYVLNPSNFWVQTNDNLDMFENLMDKISDVYDASETGNKILENPEPGMLCCARYSKDMHFYRGVIEQVVDNVIYVYFLDFGNTEKVLVFDVRPLLPEFQELPALAISCSLACAFPVQDVWTNKETDFFKNLVFGNPVTLHVVGKQNEKYSVNIQCMNGSKQLDVLTFMVQAGYAVRWQIKPDPVLNSIRFLKKRDSKCRSKSMWHKDLTQNKNIGAYRNVNQLLNIHTMTKKSSSDFPQWEKILSKKYGRMSEESNTMSPYKEHRFKPGTVLKVICCCCTSPGDFSCQLQAKSPELNNLMDQIQIHYKTLTSPYQSGQLACVVKDSKDGKWYRACIQKYISKTRIEVVLVDYGNQISVLLEDIQAILPDFLTLECQAFRCCLNSVTQSLKFDPDNWTMEACNDFKSFISSSSGLLTCTISALVKNRGCLYNVVDLWTPSVRAQQFLLDCGHDQFCSLEFPRSLAPSFSLCSFYYSSFDMKIGNVEEVCVTHIISPTEFYCQLTRNADDIDKLFRKIAEVSQMASYLGQTNTQRLCLAKYFEDGMFYRAFASPVGSSDYFPVYFVDFGNKQVVANAELINVPDHASEILFTPMQAVECYLSDLKDTEIAVEINKWFENNFLGKELKAVIVAKESDGQLGVELYDNHLHINKKIKELLLESAANGDPKYVNRDTKKPLEDQNVKDEGQITAITTEVKRQTENQINSCSQNDEIHAELLESTTECNANPKYVNRNIEKPLENRNVKHEKNITAIITKVKRETENQVHSCYQNDGEIYDEYVKETVVDLPKQFSKSVQVSVGCEKTELVLQNTSGKKDKSVNGELSDDPTLEFKEMLADNMTELHSQQPSTLGQVRSTSAKQKYRDLIQYNIEPNSEVMCYISFIASPSSFYVHVEENENKILQLVEELNRCTLVLEPQTDIEEGDIVLAEYEVDHCIYRAVVRAVQSEAFCEVEFIDYGNLSTVNVSKIYKIETKFLNLPRLSIQCFLSYANCMFLGKNWSCVATAYFVSKGNDQQVICKFLEQHGEQWEVLLWDLFCLGVSVIEDLTQMETSLGLLNMPVAGTGEVIMWLPVANVGNNQSNQIVHEEVESGPTGKSLPKIAYQKINPGQLEIAEIGHISRNGNFYVKLTKDEQTLLHLNMMAAEEAAQTAVAVENIHEGFECLTKSKITFQWHRSEVIKKFVNENILVFLVDLGIYEMVSFNDTRRLSRKMRRIPRCAIPCKWAWIGNTDSLAFERALKIVKGQEIKILFVKYLESALIWQVDILVGGILLLEFWSQIFNQGMLEKCNVLEGLNVKMMVPEYSFQKSSISWAKFQNNRHYPGFVISVTDPSNFCIQLEDSFKTMEVLFKLLSDLPENLPSVPKDLIVAGTGCLIKTEPNKKWNRVEVSEISDQLILIFVDDGILAPIPISNFHRLKVLPEKLVNVPRLTYPCCLFGVLPVLGEQWNEEAKHKIQHFLRRQGLLFEFRKYCGMKMEVNVLCEKTSAADVLVASGCAVYSFMSINWLEFNELNSQILYDPLQTGSHKSCDAVTVLQPEKEDHEKSALLSKLTCNKCSRKCSSKKLYCRRHQCKKVALHSKTRKNENLLKCNKSCIVQCCLRGGLKDTYAMGILAETAQPDPSGLSTNFDALQINEENPPNKHCTREVKTD